MKKNKLIILMILPFLLCGCTKGKLHEYGDFINYVDNLQCGLNGKEYSCGLEGKYEVISDKIELMTEEDDIEYNDKVKGSKKRTLTFKIKNTNFTFDVVSRYVCTGSIDASCLEFTYDLLSDFHYIAFDYYTNEYNTQIGYDNKLEYIINGEILHNYFVIKTSDDLSYVIYYLNNFLDYINNLNIKFIDKYESFGIKFINNNEADRYFYIYFDIDENGKYIYKFRDEYMPNDHELRTYINNYMQDNNIVLLG